MIFAAVDVGSNAVRLLVSEVHRKKDGTIETEKTSLVRVPIRLGEDTFKTGFISDRKIKMLIDALRAFEQLFRVYRPISYMACATAALREAKNRNRVIKKVSGKSAIHLQIIDGLTEAKIIGAASELFLKDKKNFYLFADVGGGSTELSLFHKGNLIELHSFKIGTVRILNHKDKSNEWKNLKKYLEDIKSEFSRRLIVVGSGGNINKFSKLFARKGAKALTIRELKDGLNRLKRLSISQRISLYGLRHDRADVIVPAGNILLTIMQELRSNRILVPRIGLSDGMIRHLYHAYVDGMEPPEGIQISYFKP